MTYTCALLEVNPETHADIKARIDKINAAISGNQYGHMFHDSAEHGLCIDLTHIMLVVDPAVQPVATEPEYSVEHAAKNILRAMDENGYDRVSLTREDFRLLVEGGKDTVFQVTWEAGPSFQDRVGAWCEACFGKEKAEDTKERLWRFGEEALELMQAGDATRDDINVLADYVWGRPKGEFNQEVGGVMNTLAALCYAKGVDMMGEGEIEVARINRPEVMEKIRAKQKAKDEAGLYTNIKTAPLPGNTEAPYDPSGVGLIAEECAKGMLFGGVCARPVGHEGPCAKITDEFFKGAEG